MRKTVVALAVALLAGLGAFAPAGVPVAHAASGVKVAIIVGATHSATPRYRDDANEIYAEAIKYSDNVVKVYSPRATASKVKAAVSGASIVVYLGAVTATAGQSAHARPEVRDQGRLRAQRGPQRRRQHEWTTRTSTTRPAVDPRSQLRADDVGRRRSDLRYASAHPQPGSAALPLSTARKRVDNLAAAFLRPGAQLYRLGSQPRPRRHPGPVHHAPDHRGVLAGLALCQRPVHGVPLRAQSGLDIPDGSRWARQLLPVHRGEYVAAHAGCDRRPVLRTPAATRRRWLSPGMRAPRSAGRRCTDRWTRRPQAETPWPR